MSMEALWRDYGAAMRRVASSYLPPGAAREDLEQEIALALHQALPRFRADASTRTYLYRIAHNCGIRALHQGKRPDARPLDEVELRTREASPEEALLAGERREQLAQALRSLPLSLRQPMALRLEGLAPREIADVLGVTPEVASARLYRATQTLRALLHQGGV